jgi:hypothetical protein
VAPVPELQPVFGDAVLRCRRYVGVRPHSRDGHCGLAAKVILNGEPLCYVHTPVAFRQTTASPVGDRVLRIGREPDR